jgi:hypothetical protein
MSTVIIERLRPKGDGSSPKYSHVAKPISDVAEIAQLFQRFL